MKLNLKDGEHIRIKHDGKLAFAVYIGKGVIHIRAKFASEAKPAKHILVLDAPAEVAA